MNQNERRAFWISVGSALLAVFLLYSYTQEKSDELTEKFGARKKVVIAKRDINEMETINDTMLEITERPQEYIQPKAVGDPEIAIGQVALAPIKAGEQVLESKIMEPGPVTGLSVQVAPGRRAVTVPVDEIRGIAKLIKPGDRVDIVAALDVGAGATRRREVKTIMEDVVILATGLRIVNQLPRLFEKDGQEEFIRNIRGDTSFNTITIEASPKDAQNIIYILSTNPGALFLTLRHPSDHKKIRRGLATANMNSLAGKPSRKTLGRQLPKAAPPVRKAAPKKKKRRSGGFESL